MWPFVLLVPIVSNVSMCVPVLSNYFLFYIKTKRKKYVHFEHTNDNNIRQIGLDIGHFVVITD